MVASGAGHDSGVTERQARQVAEAARETQWRKPRFGKELFLGRFRLDLIHPHPRGDTASESQGESFLAALRDFCARDVDAGVIERDSRIPDEVVKGLRQLGAFG